ncbi:hypothetical protein B0T14DRAFT_497832 [Immersiella caudata]|uniref:2EXR domain-containing protein n=1 Tax=Immersiella caudata TaxID=314043 RepID=A0AA40BWT5_9PEZI|nr:hypothetical protein B0T14DRAFT_497832 [Immersiella caudata]
MAATAFTRFPDLPAELRIEIWHCAATSKPTSAAKSVCIFPEIRSLNPDHISYDDEPKSEKPVVFEIGCPAMLLTSHEPRSAALQCGVWRAYNPSIDILYVPPSRLHSFRTYLRCADRYEAYSEPRPSNWRTTTGWITSSSHLALRHREHGLEKLGSSLSALSSLQTISFVFSPSASPGQDTTKPRLHFVEALEPYDKYGDNSNLSPKRGYIKPFDSYFRNVTFSCAQPHLRPPGKTHQEIWRFLDIDKMLQELERALGSGVTDELMRLEFEANKAVVEGLWSHFAPLDDLRSFPICPRLRLEARRFGW